MSGVSANTAIVYADSVETVEQIHALFIEYAESLGFSLCFQGFDEELASLPGKYAPPSGRLLLALHDEQVAGCVGLRALEDGGCEMKRLYVRPAYRGLGVGRALAEAIVQEARLLGYSTMRLDRLHTMIAAKGLYHSLGFREIPPYYHNPIEGVAYLELRLRD